MLQGPANRPPLLVSLAALAAVVAIVALRRGVLVAAAALALGLAWAIARALWSRRGPQRRAGRVRRSWPWHED